MLQLYQWILNYWHRIFSNSNRTSTPSTFSHSAQAGHSTSWWCPLRLRKLFPLWEYQLLMDFLCYLFQQQNINRKLFLNNLHLQQHCAVLIDYRFDSFLSWHHWILCLILPWRLFSLISQEGHPLHQLNEAWCPLFDFRKYIIMHWSLLFVYISFILLLL